MLTNSSSESSAQALAKQDANTAQSRSIHYLWTYALCHLTCVSSFVQGCVCAATVGEFRNPEKYDMTDWRTFNDTGYSHCLIRLCTDAGQRCRDVLASRPLRTQSHILVSAACCSLDSNNADDCPEEAPRNTAICEDAV